MCFSSDRGLPVSFSGLSCLLIPLVSVHGTADSLALLKVTEFWFVLCGPQVLKVCHLSVLWVTWDINQFLRQPSTKLECLMQGEATGWAPSPRCRELCQFLSAVLQVLWCCHSCWTLFCSLLPPGIQGYSGSSSVLCIWWDRNHFHGQPPEKSEHWWMFHCCLSLPREKLQVGIFLPLVSSAKLREGLTWLQWN